MENVSGDEAGSEPPSRAKSGSEAEAAGRALRESEVQNLKVFGENQDVAAFATSPSGDQALRIALRGLPGRRMDLSGPDSSSVVSAQLHGASLRNAADVSVPLRRNRASLVSFSALSAFPVALVQTGRPPGPRECDGHERRTGRDLPQRTQGTQRLGRTGSPSQTSPMAVRPVPFHAP